MCIPIVSSGQVYDDFKLADTIDGSKFHDRLINIKMKGADKANNNHLFDYELFVNKSLQKQIFNYSSDQINDLLTSTVHTIKPSDLLQVVLLNPEHRFIEIQRANETLLSNDGEIFLDFSQSDTTAYTLEVIPRKNLSFFYIENTDGIKNIRSIIDHIEEVTWSGNGFMIYYNGPGEPIIINNERNLPTFFNALFTSTTQPPFPSEELKKVSESLQRFIPEDITNMHLDLNFYIGQLSYNRLKNRFVVSLVDKLAASYYEMQYTVRIYTDFDVKEKEKGFEYINITKL